MIKADNEGEYYRLELEDAQYELKLAQLQLITAIEALTKVARSYNEYCAAIAKNTLETIKEMENRHYGYSPKSKK